VLKLLRDKRFAWIPSVSAATIVLLVGLVLAPGLEYRLETVVYDRAMRSSSAMPSPNVIVVTVDQASTERLGSWPWPRSIHAQLLRRLHDYGAHTVAFAVPMTDTQSRAGLDRLQAALELLKTDTARSEQTSELRKLLDSSVADLDDDRALTEAIALHGTVILPVEANIDSAQPTGAATVNERAYATATEKAVSAAPRAQLRPPTAALAGAARSLAHSLIQTESDQVVRGDIAAVRDGDRLVPSLALAVAAALDGIEVGQINFLTAKEVVIGERHIALTDGFRWRGALFPAQGPRAITRFSYWQVLAGEVGAEQFHGRTVVVGLDTSVSMQGFTTPFGDASPSPTVIASFAASLASDRTYREPLWGIAIQWLLCFGVLALAVWLLPQLGVLWVLVATLVLSGALLFLEVAVLNFAGIWLHLALPTLGLIAATLGTSTARAAFRLSSPRARANDPVGSLRTLGLTFQGQGQLDLAYETFRRCPADGETLELIYGLGQDYERRRQFGKAAEVYGYIASVDARFKDVQPRRERMKRSEIALNAAAAKSGGKQDSGQLRNSASVTPLRPEASAPKHSGKQTLGRYEIERELGKGAMGVVYLGRDPKINRVVAIKAIALAEEFDEDALADARARFFREAEMAGRLNHPGIVTVYDAGEDRGLAFIAMEYLRGEHLSRYAEPIHLLPVAKVLALMARVADALDYAHKQNVVHRDIKPANIMFNADTDELKITDFGIARLTDTSRTKTGIVLGTPSFMSPEQLEGRPLDGRSDLFSLGVAFYQLLSGQLPFRADSMTRLMHKIAIEPHIPLLSLRPDLPEAAEQIATRALAKSMQDRYQTGAELAVALRGCIRMVMRKDALAR